jgi:hypothetical protein
MGYIVHDPAIWDGIVSGLNQLSSATNKPVDEDEDKPGATNMVVPKEKFVTSAEIEAVQGQSGS